MGMTVVIRHEGGYTTRYSSLSSDVAVSAGQDVALGQTIGTVGTTALMENALGDHVHFTVLKNDQTVDPAEFLK
jgi:murein DD-endopeptidase MepM/ murein hydrolase activator NlpD